MTVKSWLTERLGDGSSISRAIAPGAGAPSWARAMTFAFAVSLVMAGITGVGLSFSYAPSAAGAWASVFFIERVLSSGWYVRSVHMMAAEASLVTGVLALVLAAFEGRYRGRRDLAFYAQALVVGLAFVFCVTGNPLRWDDRGYFGFAMESSIAGEVPLFGKLTRGFLVGGATLGNFTLTRLYALHTLLLPLGVLGAFSLGLAASRSEARTTEDPDLYPQAQLVRDVALSAIALLAIAALGYAIRAPLEAPVDPLAVYHARPEWYFQSLYVVRNAVPAKLQAPIATSLPLLLGIVIAALPRRDRNPARPLAKRAPILGLLVIPVVGAIALTFAGLRADARDPALAKARAQEGHVARRALQVAKVQGIPPAGALAMLREDPVLHGEDLFREHCAACHKLGDMEPPDGKLTAPALDGWGTEKWVLALFDDPDAPDKFGKTPYEGKMPSMARPPKDPKLAASWKALKKEDLEAMARFLAGEAAENPSADHDADGAKLIRQRCTSCHLFRGETDDAEGLGPELSGWGSTAWTLAQVANPGTSATYRPIALAASLEGHMPRYDEKLSPGDVDLIGRFVRHRARAGK
jgi:ubiquinol-cytochrome c reductase cytochrome b subunit